MVVNDQISVHLINYHIVAVWGETRVTGAQLFIYFDPGLIHKRLLYTRQRTIKGESTRDRSNVLKMSVRARRKYQVVIPRSVPIRLELGPGMELQVVEHNVRVEVSAAAQTS